MNTEEKLDHLIELEEQRNALLNDIKHKLIDQSVLISSCFNRFVNIIDSVAKKLEE